MTRNIVFLLVSIMMLGTATAQKKRAREHGIKIGVLTPGPLNAITDVVGVRVGHTTVHAGNVATGVTTILPHEGNIFQSKVPAAVFVGNGFGKLAGSTQIMELGNLETPIVLTNTLSVPVAMDALTDFVLAQPGNEEVRSVNAVVGETNDGFLNDIRGKHVTKAHVMDAITNATDGPVREGNVGAGTGTICFGYKGGIGTSSRKLPESVGGFTVGVLVQTNFGGVLQIDGVPVGEALKRHFLYDQLKKSDGSCMIIVATDAPLDARNLERLAARAMMGLARTGGIASNGSGDYVIAFSTHPDVRIPHESDQRTITASTLINDAMSPLFLAVIEATEEAIINSLFTAETLTGMDGRTVPSLPVDDVLKIIEEYNRKRP